MANSLLAHTVCDVKNIHFSGLAYKHENMIYMIWMRNREIVPFGMQLQYYTMLTYKIRFITRKIIRFDLLSMREEVHRPHPHMCRVAVMGDVVLFLALLATPVATWPPRHFWRCLLCCCCSVSASISRFSTRRFDVLLDSDTGWWSCEIRMWLDRINLPRAYPKPESLVRRMGAGISNGFMDRLNAWIWDWGDNRHRHGIDGG